MKSPLTTLCYIEKDGCYLMLHRVSKKKDVNKGKWIGVGGHFEEGESPEECLLREVKEETGLTLTAWQFRGLLTFAAEGWPSEYISVYTADGFTGDLSDCTEGKLAWVPKEEILSLNLWEGDLIFLRLLLADAPFFSMKLAYKGDRLCEAALDGRPLELFDVCDAQGQPTGRVTERGTAHALGLIHRTVHIWVARRKKEDQGGWQVLLQKRSRIKEAFPGRYDTSCAGHVQAGDDCLSSARRELEEELGLAICPEELHFAGWEDQGEIRSVFGGTEIRDHEIAFVYVCFCDQEAERFCLQEEEVEEVFWMDYSDCAAAMKSGDARFCTKNLNCLKMAGCILERRQSSPESQ